MINSVTLIGRLGADPELKTNINGTSIVNFPLACHEYRRTDGGREMITHWFSCCAFGNLARWCSDFAHRGARVGIRGSLKQNTWETKTGEKRNTVEIQVRDIEFISSIERKSRD